MTNEMEDHISQKLGLPLIYPSQSQKKIASASPQVYDSPTKTESNPKLNGKVKIVKIIEKNYEE
jgi:hypothetical protein